MYNGGIVSYLLLGVFVVLFSTVLSQKNTAPAKNANSGANPAASSPVTSPKVSKKGIDVISSNQRPTSNANTVTEANREGVTDVPEEREIGEDPTTSADGLTQRTESNYGTDPIEQHDATTPIRQLPQNQQAPTAAPAPVAPAAAVAPKSINQKASPPVVPKATNQKYSPPVIPKGTNRMARPPMVPRAPRPPPRKPAVYIPRDPIVHARPMTPEPKRVPSEPIVHARPTTPEPKEVEAEGTTSGYYYDYYNNYNSQYDGRNGSGINQRASPRESACPVFKETIMEHHVILRRNGCEIVLSQDDAIRWFGRPTGPLVYSRKYL